MVLHIDGLDDMSRRNLCEVALLKIKGIISFTFQMAVQRCAMPFDSKHKGGGTQGDRQVAGRRHYLSYF